jgi:hypothetical protein
MFINKKIANGSQQECQEINLNERDLVRRCNS